jgi:hypothetical protein
MMSALTIVSVGFPLIAAGFAFVAAVLWFRSAKIVKTPPRFAIHVVRPPGEGPLGVDPMDGTYIGQGYSKDLDELADALKRQSNTSAWAARCAGISALLWAASALIALCPSVRG